MEGMDDGNVLCLWDCGVCAVCSLCFDVLYCVVFVGDMCVLCSICCMLCYVVNILCVVFMCYL